MPEDKCKKALEAASEVISEEACQDGEFVKANIGDYGTLIWVPEGALEHQPHGDHEGEELTREEMIKSCMKSEWAKGLASAMTTSPEAQEEVAREVCEGLYD